MAILQTKHDKCDHVQFLITEQLCSRPDQRPILFDVECPSTGMSIN